MPTIEKGSVAEAIEIAFTYHRAGDLETAASVYDQILCQIEKPDPNLFFGLGTLMVSQQKYGMGIMLLNLALQYAPENAPILTNLACAHKHLGHDEKSLGYYEKALSLEPEQADILAGISGYWINKGQADKVVEFARKALAIDPEHHAAHMHLGLGLLEQGNFAEAWPHYEHRWETLERVNDKRPYKAPKWNGQFVNKLAIHGEQGLGDEILYMSCLYKVRGMAEHIVIECAERLIPTFEAAFGLKCYPDHASLIAAEGEPDAYISMGSLPGIVGLPDGRLFLRRPHKNQGHRPRVGYTWKGGTLRTNIKQRTIDPKLLDPILAIPGIDFVPVQYGDGTSFDDLQQQIADCDLVISVCQTAVHQAGAMGVDCWVMVPEQAAWRYCGNSMLPWYKSIRFFKQESGDWEYPIQMIAASLRERYALAA